MSKNDQAGKTALLEELLGEARVADWQKSGVLPQKPKEKSDQASVAWHRNRLIEKFRERGLLPSAASMPAPKQSRPAAKTGSNRIAKHSNPEFTPGGLGARLAKHLDPDRLADEHPAVIALFLRSQTAQLRSQVLRGLPGGQARAVMRILRGNTSPAKPKPQPPLNSEATVARVEKPQLETDNPPEPPSRPSRTRRAV